jgi:hypothetical protein
MFICSFFLVVLIRYYDTHQQTFAAYKTRQVQLV